MIDLVLQAAVSNLLVSLALAAAALVVHRTRRIPAVAHLLWVLVLVKLVTPPIVHVPVIPVPGLEPPPARSAESTTLETSWTAEAVAAPAIVEPASIAPSLATAKAALLAAWGLGSLAVLVWTLVRVVRFDRLLRQASRPAPPEVRRDAAQLAARLGLRRVPDVRSTTARLSPMVWWCGGRVRVVVPDALLRELDEHERRWVLAHELAHVRRRDHVVRWLEWLACVAFWWNPVTWIARRCLRIDEEVCCDALVLASLRPRPQAYAGALMTVIEFLARPAIRPPAVASEMSSGGFLERRFRMIVSTQRNPRAPRWLSAGVALGALALLPLGVAYGQNIEAVGARLRQAVAGGELTREQATAMMELLHKFAAKSDVERTAQQHFADAQSLLKKAVEAGKISTDEAVEKLAALKEKLARHSDQDHGLLSHPDVAAPPSDLLRLSKEHKAKGDDDALATLLKLHDPAATPITTRDTQLLRELELAMSKKAALVADPAQPSKSVNDVLRAEAELKRAIEAARAAESAAIAGLTTARQAQPNPNAAPVVDRERYARIESEVVRAVEEGRLSETDARAKLTRLREVIGLQPAAAAPEAPGLGLDGFASAVAELKRAVDAGKISERDAIARIASMRDMLAAQTKPALSSTARQDLSRAEIELMRAYEAGVISADDARRAMLELQRRVVEQERFAVDWAAIERHIEDAVKRGELTREEAQARYRDLKERLSRERSPGAR